MSGNCCKDEHLNGTKLTLDINDNLKVKPDTVVITASVGNKDDNDLCETYEDAAKIGAEKMSVLMSIIKNLGIVNECIKSSRIKVTPIYISVNTKKETGGLFGSKETENSYERRLSGYGYSSSIEVRLPVENENIAKLYCKLAADESAKKVDVNYILVETEKWHDELLEKIIAKAKHKASIIANASSMEIDKILNINMSSNRYYGASLKFSNAACVDGFDCCYEDDEMFEENIAEALDTMANIEKELSESLTIEFLLK